MTTLEKIVWIAVVLAMVLGVANELIPPIVGKVGGQKDEINNINFDFSYEYKMNIDPNRYLEAIERLEGGYNDYNRTA